MYLVLIFILSCTENDILQKIYFNGYIWTGDSNNPIANAIVVSDNIISYVGTDEEALLVSNENTIKGTNIFFFLFLGIYSLQTIANYWTR